ncbi:MAG: EamA family transporter [Bacteroides sp. 43_108]|nr:MAG: EamA family transporter [Bacteroides sp. 43_108]
MTTDNKAVVYASLAVLSWSTVATAFKVALSYLTHFEMLFVACLTSLVIFAVLLTVQRKWGLVAKLSLKQWGYFALVGLLNPVAYYLVLFKAYNLLPAQVAQPINYAWPIVLLVMLAIFAGQPIPKKKYIGMVLSLAGVAVISLGGGGNGGMNLNVTGLLLAALSAVLWASYWMVNNLRSNRADASVGLFATFLFGAVYLTVGALCVGVDLNTVPGVLSGMYVGAFEMGIPFIFFGLAMRKTSNPALINQLCYLSPFMSLFFISVVLGEKIVVSTYVGLVMIVLGIVYNQYFAKGKAAK